MIDPKLRWPLLAAATAMLVTVGLFVRVGQTPPSAIVAPVPASKASPERIIAAAATRITEESRRAVPPPEVEAAPGLRGSTDLARVDPPPPPEGYAFVEHFGDMAKGRIEGGTVDEQPTESGPGWLDAPGAATALTSQAAASGRDWAYGWIRLASDARPADLALALAGTGAHTVESSGRMVRARLPGDASRLRTILALDAVDALGAAPPAAKLAAFDDDPGGVHAGTVPVFVTLMDADTDGRWRAALADLGAVVGGYDPALRVYRANADRGVIEALAATDFVLAVEPIPLVEATHDTAVPAMGADALRTWDAPGIFLGMAGTSVPIAVMDTGLNINHPDIASHRDSICGANFASSFGPNGPLIDIDDLWIDAGGHGTHVTGTIIGNGVEQRRFAGIAPGVRHIRFAKVLDSSGYGSGDSVAQAMDFFTQASRCSQAGRMSERAKPLVVNISLADTGRHRGRDVGARKLDATVWSHRQLYVVAQDNAGINGYSDFGAAKNSLSVGAVMDSGDLAGFSSHGPTADGRLAPNVVGTGVRVYSARGQGSRGSYRPADGTSMSSPSVAGVAALLMDAVPAHREQPALTRARLMASAIRPDPWLDEGAGFPLDNSAGPGPLQARFGMGKVSARTAALARDEPDGWKSGSATSELADGEYAYHDIEVPEGASRLDVVMSWDEPPADAVASTVLNDLDLWLDREADCETAACGEHVSRSRVDNVEWIVLRNPEAGTYRAKVLAHRVYTAAPRAAIAWTVIRGASTPTLSIEADTERLSETGTHELKLTLASSAYVAAGTRLRVDCRTGGSARSCTDLVTIESVSLVREDGIAVSLEDEQRENPTPSGYTRFRQPIDFGVPMPIGEVSVAAAREIVLRVSILRTGGATAGLHFVASAWNARSGSVSVDIGSGDGTAEESARPANDAFADATVIEGAQGSLALDLLEASVEPGEPMFDGDSRRPPAASVWYSWTAPADGPFRFRVPALAVDYSFRDGVPRHDRVHVFTGDAITVLEEVSSSLWHATFFAVKGSTYRIRVSGVSRAVPMHLRWSTGNRPVNDDFAEAVVLEGESGSVDGTSVGATLEPGESFGEMAATTWYRWLAPDDGRWEFSSLNHRVLVLEGTELEALRLVGTQPWTFVQVPVGAGREYRVAVAEIDAAGLGHDYELRWSRITSTNDGDNDAFEDAPSVGDEGSSGGVVDIDDASTVEPDEPEETGVRTKWWTWQAPADDLYTWRLQANLGEFSPSYPKLRVTLWTGASLDDLVLAAQIGPGTPFATLLDAVEGETYRIAAGLRNGDTAAYDWWSASGTLTWGETPGNDESAGAVAVSGPSGSTSGSTAFATGASGARSTVLGRSTLWWTYETETSGWVRFAVDGDGGPWVLTAHEDGADGLDILASSVWQRSEGDAVEVLFEAQADVRYTIALGVRRGGPGGEFTLRWDAAEAPGWLRYAGRLADGDHDSGGDPVEIRGPYHIAVRDDGGVLYLASEIGLQVFERDAQTGRLDHVQSLETDVDLGFAALAWDANRDRLLVDACGSWRSFAQVGDGTELADGAAVTVVGDILGTCAEQLLIDASGANAYSVSGGFSIEHFAVQEGGGLRFVEAVGSRVVQAVLSNDGEHVYAIANGSLRVFERDTESEALTEADFDEEIDWDGYGPVPLAITDDDSYLFVFDNYGERANLFSLEDPAAPARLATLPRFWRASFGSNYCRFADARDDTVAIDVFCPGLTFTASWDSEADELSGTDFLTGNSTDRFNGPRLPDFGAPVGLAASPDDAHLYVATPAAGILIFARDGSSVEDESGAPDLTVQRAWSSTTTLATGASFRLSALVRNRGSGQAASATLRFYRSDDESISSTDSEVDSLTLGALAASATRTWSVEATAPSVAGTYWYGACVSDVDDESDTENNCSEAVSVAVQ